MSLRAKKISKFSPTVIFMFLMMSLIKNGYAEMPNNFPKIKPGLWEITTTMEGKTLPKISQCTDAQMLAESEKESKKYEKENCSKQKYRQSGNTYYAELTCKGFDGKPIETKTESTFISANELKTKIVSISGGKTDIILSHTKRVGECTAESQKPMVDKEGNVNMDSLKEMLKNAKEFQPK